MPTPSLRPTQPPRPQPHGGLDPAELRALGLRPEDILDFSASINPLGASPAVREAIAAADPSAYPDRQCLALREALAHRLGVDTERILAGNGSTELIHLLARALLRPGDSCLILSPTFGEYQAGAERAGAEIHHLTAQESQGFCWDLDAARQAIASLRPRLVFLCNPNNPTGVFLRRKEVEGLAHAVGSDGLLALDEAYVPFVDDAWDARPLLALGNVALLRSMTKHHALAGVRLGYLVASSAVVERVAWLQPTWSVSAVAQAAGLAALDDPGHVEQGRAVVRAGKSHLERGLAELGLEALPSAANFLLVKTRQATRLRLALLRRGVAVRDCTSFGLPEHIRIGVRGVDDCQVLLEAMGQELLRG